MWSYSLSKYIDFVKNVLSQPDGADENLEVSYSLSIVAMRGCMAPVIIH